jgi:hypothetical protein
MAQLFKRDLLRLRDQIEVFSNGPKPNIVVTGGNLSDEICACRRQKLRFLRVSAKYTAIETDFAANFCDTRLAHIHRRSNRRKT